VVHSRYESLYIFPPSRLTGIVGHSLETFPEQMAAVRDAGHEMCVLPMVASFPPSEANRVRGLHGYSHEAREISQSEDLYVAQPLLRTQQR